MQYKKLKEMKEGLRFLGKGGCGFRYQSNKNGFSLIEIIFTIIIIGLAMGAITESFIAGSAKSVNIVNEETAVNIVKQTMAALNYCRNGGTIAGICSFEKQKNPKTIITIWDNPALLDSTQPTPLNNECFYTVATAVCVTLSDTTGKVAITGNCAPTANYISAVVNTGWFALNTTGTCPAAPASYPSVTLSTVYANY